ncbi:MAG: TM2 domain-containing protein [Zymomonas mobilis subsp. pomaceae]|uniref:TM2 domain-containing protein n=1 Tax=Zymomonas mobilis subsp. pomaceae (strain ATCC 29192 / DSM 22645 / JCM 10191 / CCUG 17912 / NBRC 13757 / NCIMB 11200 / NRRL B-4491 / Barker I) TaxID=579138 RepID=F8ES56_ZYMMT|nr:TM2 domain-containing protein [Zymomonas mobilis]AEI37631.1 hypothetical protein Zymop_0729 [Zymomonas mobilis subsp. pomaceae ATCC 29192]MDX5948999.1 TM2 domain-containing protein [Zymomonas mobilis subsp. pomaceae]GEB88804.1 hypothetical protein ZMO02_04410 [Zymomonas mobilis subsp. pomaceae]
MEEFLKNIPPNLRLIYNNSIKSIFIAYVLWLFFGVLGAHRFYVGAHKSGFIQLITFLYGLFVFENNGQEEVLMFLYIWLLTDAILLFGLVKRYNIRKFEELLRAIYGY